MSFNAGDKDATSGMSKEIFDMINQNMSPLFGGSPPAKTTEAWKNLANAIAVGVTKQLMADFAKMQTAMSGDTPHFHMLTET